MSIEGKSLAVLTPMYGGLAAHNYIESFLKLLMTCGKYRVPFSYSFTYNESLISRARNRLADEYMKNCASTHALYIDADIGFEADDILGMLEADRDIIGVPCSKKSFRWDRIQKALQRNGHNFSADELSRIGGDFVFNFEQFAGQRNMQLNELQEMRNVGTGIMMIRRQVFEGYKAFYPDRWYESKTDPAALPGPIVDYFRCGINPETREYDSEDYWFCLPKGTRVYGDMLPIEQHAVGNQVMSHAGVLRPVLATTARNYQGELIRVEPHYGAGFSITPRHSVYVYRDGGFDFIPAEELRISDKLVVPIQLNEVVSGQLSSRPRNRFIQERDGKFRYTRTHRSSQWFPSSVEMSDDLALLLGYWTAEGGHTCGGFSDFSFSRNEVAYVGDVRFLLKKCLNLESTTLDVKETTRVLCHCSALQDFLTEHCGDLSRNRHVPEIILSGKLSWIKAFLRGHWRGDGCKSFPFSLRTVSEKLAHDLRYMLIRCGIYPSLHDAPCNKAGRIAFTVSITQNFYKEWAEIIGVPDYSPRLLNHGHGGKPSRVTRTDDKFLVDIRTLSEVEHDGPVFNLKVGVDETYNANGFAIHNCMDSKVAGFKVWLAPWVRTSHMGAFKFLADMPAVAALAGEL
jgi:hypothetical protein